MHGFLRYTGFLSRYLVAALCAAFVLSACATTGHDSDPGAGAVKVAREWQSLVAARRFEDALDLVADDFTSKVWARKADLAYYFTQARERGFFRDAMIPVDVPEVMVDGNEAVVYPVTIRADLGTTVFLLTLRRSEESWVIISVEMELY